MGERDLDPVLVGVPADREVAKKLVPLHISGQEQALGASALLPLGLAQTCLVQMVVRRGQGLPTLVYPIDAFTARDR